MKGQYAAGAVRDSVARKYVKLGIEIVAESGPVPNGPLVAGKGTPASLVQNIKKALLELDPRSEESRNILRRLDEDYKNGFVEAGDKDYEDIRAKINAVPQTCGRGCHPKIKL